MNASTWIAILLGALNVLFLYLNARQTRWKGAAEALTVENQAVRTRCSELDKQNQALISENANLKAKADLTPILQSVDQLNVSIARLQESNTKAFNEVLTSFRQMQSAFQEFAITFREKHLLDKTGNSVVS